MCISSYLSVVLSTQKYSYQYQYCLWPKMPNIWIICLQSFNEVMVYARVLILIYIYIIIALYLNGCWFVVSNIPLTCQSTSCDPVTRLQCKDEKLIKKQTYMNTETCKLHSRVLWIFLPNLIKIDRYNFELYRFKFCAFFETQCKLK